MVLEMRRLGLSTPDWIISGLQATSDDLNVKFSIKGLVETERSPLFDPVKELSRRLSEAEGEEVALSFDLGSQIAALLFQTVGIAAGHGDLAGARTDEDFGRNWMSASGVINGLLRRTNAEDLAVNEASRKSAEGQLSLCDLKRGLNKKWEVADFDCAELLGRLRFVLLQAAALEAAKPE